MIGAASHAVSAHRTAAAAAGVVVVGGGAAQALAAARVVDVATACGQRVGGIGAIGVPSQARRPNVVVVEAGRHGRATLQVALGKRNGRPQSSTRLRASPLG